MTLDHMVYIYDNILRHYHVIIYRKDNTVQGNVTFFCSFCKKTFSKFKNKWKFGTLLKTVMFGIYSRNNESQNA